MFILLREIANNTGEEKRVTKPAFTINFFGDGGREEREKRKSLSLSLMRRRKKGSILRGKKGVDSQLSHQIPRGEEEEECFMAAIFHISRRSREVGKRKKKEKRYTGVSSPSNSLTHRAMRKKKRKKGERSRKG